MAHGAFGVLVVLRISELRGYRALEADAETDATLVAVPTKQAEKKPRASE
jgi:hypothetical protein